MERWRGVQTQNYKKLPYDMIIGDLKIIVEVDGDQHFKNHKLFNRMTLQEQMNRAINKEDLAKKHECSVIRVQQRDVFRDKNEWREKFLVVIEDVNMKDHCVVKLYRVN